MLRRLPLVVTVAVAAAVGPLLASAMPSRAFARGVPAAAVSFPVDGAIALRGYQGLVEEHMAGVLHAIKALAVTDGARSGEWSRIKPALEQLSADLPTDATISYILPDGGYATTAVGPNAGNLSDRDYFPTLMAGGDVVGSLVVSKSTGHRSIIIATPVSRDGKVVAAIGVTLRSALISQLVIDRCQLPANLTFYALDSAGRTAIHKDQDLMFVYPAEVGDASLKAAVATMLGRKQGTVRYRYGGVNRTAIFRASEPSGWRFVLVRVDK